MFKAALESKEVFGRIQLLSGGKIYSIPLKSVTDAFPDVSGVWTIDFHLHKMEVKCDNCRTDNEVTCLLPATVCDCGWESGTLLGSRKATLRGQIVGEKEYKTLPHGHLHF